MFGNPLLRSLNFHQPINWECPLNNGLVSRWQVLPNFPGSGWGGPSLQDLNTRNGQSVTVGTLTNGAIWKPGGFGRPGGVGAIDFDGTNDYINHAGSSSFLNITGALSMSAWLRMVNNPATLSEGACGIFENNTTNPNKRHYAIVVTTSGFFQAAVSADGSTSFLATGAVDRADGLWHHVVMVYVPSTSLTLYVDGVQEAQNTTSIPASLLSTSLPFRIGHFADLTNANFYFTGQIDDVRVYNVSILPEQIVPIYLDSIKGSPNTLNWISRGERMVNSAAAAAFKSAWARNANTVIQFGGRCA